MDIFVLVKLVPDTESRLKIANGAIDYSGLNYIVNPYDEYAVEEAIRIAELYGGTASAVVVGNPREGKLLLNILAMGIDQVFIVDDPAIENSDPIAVARIIHNVIADKACDIILAGKESVDFYWGATPIALAKLMNIHHVSLAVNIEFTADKCLVQKASDEGLETYELPKPCVITCEKGLNEPRLPKLQGIMKAKKKPQITVNLSQLGIDVSAVGAAAAGYMLESVNYPAEKQTGRIISADTPEEKVQILVKALREEAKVI